MGVSEAMPSIIALGVTIKFLQHSLRHSYTNCSKNFHLQFTKFSENAPRINFRNSSSNQCMSVSGSSGRYLFNSSCRYASNSSCSYSSRSSFKNFSWIFCNNISENLFANFFCSISRNCFRSSSKRHSRDSYRNSCRNTLRSVYRSSCMNSKRSFY